MLSKNPYCIHEPHNPSLKKANPFPSEKGSQSAISLKNQVNQPTGPIFDPWANILGQLGLLTCSKEQGALAPYPYATSKAFWAKPFRRLWHT